MSDQSIHHYPPELMALLINTIPRLIRGKKDVLGFFKGCGVPEPIYRDLTRKVDADRKSITKFAITRLILERLNDRGDAMLRQRREILRRVANWDDFSSCYDNDRMEAKGYVAEVRKVVNVKDSFTRMNLEREKAEWEHRRKQDQRAAELQKLAAEREQIRKDLNALFLEPNASKRGLALEHVLNSFFKFSGVLIRESFRRVGTGGEGVVEQIDGVSNSMDQCTLWK